MTAKLERKAYAILGANAPLHNWSVGRRGTWTCRTKGCNAKSSTPDDTRACLAKISRQNMIQIVQLPNDIGNASGKRRELRTLELILAMRSSNPMIISARLATKEEDASGIDIVIDTANGSMFVQVKSGKDACREWRKKYGATIGYKTVLVRWDWDRIVVPTNLRQAIQDKFSRLTHSAEPISAASP